MSYESEKQNEEIIDEFISRIIDIEPELKNYCNDKKNNKEVSNILKLMLLSETKNDLKIHSKELIEKLEEFGMTVYPKSKDDIPLLWTNGRPNNVFEDKFYNSEVGHYQDEDSPIFKVLWNIIPKFLYPEGEIEIYHPGVPIEDLDFEEEFDPKEELNLGYEKERLNKIYEIIKNTCCFKLRKLGIKYYSDNLHIPYDRFLSELWVEEISPKNISKIRIEFGQNRLDQYASKRGVCIPTDSVLSISELPVLLNIIAKHNIDMDLKGEPKKKIYLDNIGVSENEAVNMKYSKIKDRYGEGRDNENTGCLVLKKVNRESDIQDINYVPVKLKYLILKLEKRRLKKIEKSLKETKDKSLEQINNELGDSIKSKLKKQNKMIEKVRTKQFNRASKHIKIEDEFEQNKLRKYIIEHQNRVIKKMEGKKQTRLARLKAQKDSNSVNELG